MGVPSFFTYCLKNFPQILCKMPKNIDNLFFDINSLYHYVLNKINENINIEEVLIENIIKYIKELIEKVKAKNIYIYEDGIPNMNKIKQQRIRRFKTEYLNRTYYNQLKKKYNKFILDFDRNAISPNTKFMEKLKKEMLKFTFANKIYYSSSDDVGEGEHKIKNKLNTLKNTQTIIYGMDADIIFLSLLNENNEIYLMREDIETDIIKEKSEELMFVDIGKFKEIVKKELIKNDKIIDFVMLCYLLGNDFVPKLFELKFIPNQVNILVKIYNIIFEKTNKNIILENNVINFKFIELLFGILIDTIELKRYKERQITKMENNNYEKEIYNLENLVDYNVDIFNIRNNNELENDYNEYYFNMKYTNIEYINKITYDYFLALKWCLIYYTTDKIDWNFIYKYDNVPLLNNMYIHIKDNKWINNEINSYKFEDNTPMKEVEHLKKILPYNSIKLAKDIYIEDLYKYYENNKHMYPDKLYIDIAYNRDIHRSNIILNLII